MADINLALSVITLNINVIKCNEKAEIGKMGFKNHHQTIRCLQETYFIFKNTNRLKVKGWADISGKSNQKKLEYLYQCPVE